MSSNSNSLSFLRVLLTDRVSIVLVFSGENRVENVENSGSESSEI
jgi:hypothetical protein